MKTLKAVIFDLDSTLVDVDLDFFAIREALGIPQPHPILEWLEKMDDLDHKKKLEEELFQHELKAAQNKEVIPHVPKMLEFLKAKEIKLAVLTRNCKEVALLELEGMKHFFDPIFSREDHENCKPEPDGILDACNIWNIKPENTIMVGDYLYDLQAGQNAGTKTIWFNNPKHEQRDFSSDADHSISCWGDFLNDYNEIMNKLGFES